MIEGAFKCVEPCVIDVCACRIECANGITSKLRKLFLDTYTGQAFCHAIAMNRCCLTICEPYMLAAGVSLALLSLGVAQEQQQMQMRLHRTKAAHRRGEPSKG